MRSAPSALCRLAPLALRVYVSLPGKPTKAIVVEGNLVGGSTRRLVVRVDAEARVTAALE